MWSCLLLLCALCALIGQSAGSHLVNQTVQEGHTISLPCKASVDDSFYYRTWRRGYESLINHSSTPLFQQVGGTTPDKLPGASSDMDVDTASFNLTINSVHKEDHNVVFTCLQYKNVRHTYSYVQLQVQEAHQTALIAGVCVGVVVLLLLATGVATYRVKKRRAGSTYSSGSSGVNDDMSVGFASGSSTVRLYDKRD